MIGGFIDNTERDHDDISAHRDEDLKRLTMHTVDIAGHRLDKQIVKGVLYNEIG
jgi:hypothetical protein